MGGVRRVLWAGSMASLVLVGLVGLPMTVPAEGPSTRLTATVETRPAAHPGDAADDPAIWINQQDRSLSTVIGTDKQGALLVYDLSGRQLQSLAVGNVNNVDVRSNLVTVTNRSNNSIGIYEMDPATRRLRNVAARTITTGIQVYGSCMYRSAATGISYVFVTSTTGQVQQWQLAATTLGTMDATRVRSFAVGSKAEGCVADDEFGDFYVGEETVGIWQYGAEPGDGTLRTSVAATSAAGPLMSNVEGLTLVYGSGGAGYLIASSQGSNSFAVYAREGAHPLVTSFTVVAGNGIDGVSGTDGIDATPADLGPGFPSGVFVTQDGANDAANQNFKLVPYQQIQALLG
jgi:3-phytase